MANSTKKISRRSVLFILGVAIVGQVSAQSSAPSRPLTLAQIVATALHHYPSLRAAEADVRRAASDIANARTAYLPKLDVIAGINRASRNNVLGLLLPSQVIAPISGPVLGTNSLASAWGSTVGALVSWEPFDFGLRAANVGVAEAERTHAQATATRTGLELSTLAADSALTVVAAEQTQIAAQAAVDRAGELGRITDALVKAELRPGAESSLARAEYAAAEAQLIRARQAVGEATAALSSLLGVDAIQFSIAREKLLSLPGPSPPEQSLSANPLIREHDAAVAESRARLKAIDSSYFPRVALQGTSYARGSGALPDGRLLPGANGLGPNVQNWGVGVTIDFSTLDLPAIRARRGAESARLDAEQAREEQAAIDLKSKRDQAFIAYRAARDLAQTTPVAIEAAQSAVQQSRARYQAGLGSELEVVEAHRSLAQAEIDDSLARLGVWRARLAVYALNGDINPLLAEVSQ
ncbi:MAG: outer rane efflux protein [Bryobacterales bacterium]|nr:outer rane efflux protein [Bryobacterales bacterium]